MGFTYLDKSHPDPVSLIVHLLQRLQRQTRVELLLVVVEHEQVVDRGDHDVELLATHMLDEVLVVR